MYCAEYQRSQGKMEPICRTQCKSCYNSENSVIKKNLTTEKRDALHIIKIFRNEIEMESIGVMYDPLNSEDLDHLALCVSIKHVELILKSRDIDKLHWSKVLKYLESLM